MWNLIRNAANLTPHEGSITISTQNVDEQDLLRKPSNVPRNMNSTLSSVISGCLMKTDSFRTLLKTTAPNATILVRMLVGAVFLSEGIQKFLFSAELGVGRFAKIGIPSPPSPHP